METIRDEFTSVHLMRWLANSRCSSSEECITAFNKIASFLAEADDIDYWLEKGWPAIFDAAIDRNN